ncbi:MAG: ABC transporter substrate-binding protein, partial [Alphaproteobacteria bacterium]|nr:ABC transporter substrate-binding protein [Alphaproteobacteria bacterium]
MKIRLPALVAACLFAALPAAAEEKLTVLLDWFINPDHGPLYVAQERGYFADAGLAVEFVPPADPNDPPKIVAAGKADLA